MTQTRSCFVFVWFPFQQVGIRGLSVFSRLQLGVFFFAEGGAGFHFLNGFATSTWGGVIGSYKQMLLEGFFSVSTHETGI